MEHTLICKLRRNSPSREKISLFHTRLSSSIFLFQLAVKDLGYLANSEFDFQEKIMGFGQKLIRMYGYQIKSRIDIEEWILNERKIRISNKADRHKRRSKISASLGSSHIWRIYHRVKVIYMCVSEWQHEVRFLNGISINFAHVRANKSSPLTVNVMKMVP